jgi:hypothetical protein
MNTIELGEKGKSDPMVKVGLSIILISALVWPVIPTALGIDGWEILGWVFAAIVIFVIGFILLIVALIMKYIRGKKDDYPPLIAKSADADDGSDSPSSISIVQIGSEPIPLTWKQLGLGVLPVILVLIPLTIFLVTGGRGELYNDESVILALTNTEGTE